MILEDGRESLGVSTKRSSCLNVSSAQRFPHLHVSYWWWWRPTCECFKCKKVTTLECWLLVVLGTHSWIFYVQKGHHFQCWILVMIRTSECVKCKKVTITKCYLLVMMGHTPECFKCKNVTTPEFYLLVVVGTYAWRC